MNKAEGEPVRPYALMISSSRVSRGGWKLELRIRPI